MCQTVTIIRQRGRWSVKVCAAAAAAVAAGVVVKETGSLTGRRVARRAPAETERRVVVGGRAASPEGAARVLAVRMWPIEVAAAAVAAAAAAGGIGGSTPGTWEPQWVVGSSVMGADAIWRP